MGDGHEPTNADNIQWLVEQVVTLRAEKADLLAALRLIEAETRDGGQWTLRDVNEEAREIIAKAEGGR